MDGKRIDQVAGVDETRGERPARKFAPNPDYGKGTFWRCIRLENVRDRTIVALEDNSHAMRCLLVHRDGVVVDTAAEMLRVPLNTCGDAGTALASLVGMPIDTPYRTFFGDGRPALNCTHLYDIAWLALGHASRSDPVRYYEVTIPDMVDGRSAISIRRDTRIMHEWSLRDECITAPSSFGTQSLLKGFIRWALVNLKGEMLEAALVLHKGYLVSRARRHLIDASSPPPATDESRRDACFGFGASRMMHARRLGSRREFVGPGAMLQLPPLPAGWR